MKTDARIDAYIDRQADFARPILHHLRAAIAAACPDAVETLKWGFPHFLYKDEILASMAAFKQHATFGFWRGSLVVEVEGAPASGMGQFGRITTIDGLPPPQPLRAMILKAMSLADAGIKRSRVTNEKPPIEIPADLRMALAANEAAATTYDGFPPSAQREYVDWIEDAKRETTRARRVEQSVAWLAEGKRRNWRYEAC